MGHYELITAWFFFGKLALKKHFFEVHTPKFADPKEEYIKRVPVRFISADKLKLFILGLESSVSHSQSVRTSD